MDSGPGSVLVLRSAAEGNVDRNASKMLRLVFDTAAPREFEVRTLRWPPNGLNASGTFPKGRVSSHHLPDKLVPGMQQSKDKAAGPVSEKVPPFGASCRAEPVADNAKYSRCLVAVDITCGYRTNPFSLDHFCLHPRHQEIAARTTGK